MNNEFIGEQSSKIGFLFIAFIVIASGYVTQVLPCQSQKFFGESFIGRHIIGWMICFLFIMLEGGWSFDMETQDKAPVDWSNGNALDSLVYGLGLYITFLLTAKMELIPNLLLMSVLFIVYLINTQRLYWKNRKLIKEEEDSKMINVIKYMLLTSIAIFLYGIINYAIKKKKDYKNKFSLFMFFFDDEKCHSIH